MLLIFFAEGGVGFAAMVAGANTMLLVLRILRRQVAVVAQHLAQSGKPRGGGYMADLATHGIDGQRRGLRKIRDAVAVGQHDRLMIALVVEQPAIAFCTQRLDLITIMHVQTASCRQRQQLGGELLWTQPTAGRIGYAAAAGLDAGQLRGLIRRHRAGDIRGQLQGQHLGDFVRAFFIPAKLGDPAPLMIEQHRQRVVGAAGEGKGGREKARQRRIVLA